MRRKKDRSSLCDAHGTACDKARRLFIRKHQEKGHSPYDLRDIRDIIRIKVKRAERLSEDDWLDILNYAVIGVMIERGEW